MAKAAAVGQGPIADSPAESPAPKESPAKSPAAAAEGGAEGGGEGGGEGGAEEDPMEVYYRMLAQQQEKDKEQMEKQVATL